MHHITAQPKGNYHENKILQKQKQLIDLPKSTLRPYDRNITAQDNIMCSTLMMIFIKSHRIHCYSLTMTTTTVV